VSDGIVPLENVPNQSLVVNVSASGYQNRTLRIPDPSRLYDTALVPTSDGTVGDGPTPDLQGADLYGVVKTDRGRRVPNASVRVENATTSWTTTTNATGWYAVADAALAAGDYNVTVTAPNASLRDASGTVTLGSGRTQLNVTLATAGAPVFFPDSAAPTGATAVRDVTLEVAVDDPEFGTAGGETVTVEFFVDGSSVGTDTLSSAGVASTSTTLPADAQVNWSATATDSFGVTAQLANQTIRTAGTIVLRNETDSGTKLSNLANASVTYYGDTASETRTIGDETLNLSGIPTGTPTVAQFRADGYHTREVALFNLSSQQTAYLLSTDVDSSTVVFELVSYDAAFQPEQTSLILQRPLELNNTTAYRTVASGPFGATAEYQAELETGARYRILVRNDAGATRTIGPFTPRADTRQTVRITPTGDVNVTGRGARVTVRPAVRSLTAREQTVSVELSTPADVALRRATITVRAGGNLLERPQVFATGRTDLNVNLSGRAGQTLSVEVAYETADGVSDTVAVEYAIRQALSNDYSLLTVVGTITGRLPSGHVQPFTSAVALFVTVFGSVAVAARTRAGSEVVALVAVGFLGGFSVIGWVGFDVVFATAVGAIVFAALERGI
jgi:hypothetical protein